MHGYGFARLGQDAQLKFTQDGTPVANLNLAFSYGRKGDDGERPTQWCQGTVWGKRAESLAQYLTKGTGLAVSLSDVHIETFQKKDGNFGASLNARVDDLEFAGGGQAQQGQPQQQASGGGAPDEPPVPDDQDIPFIRQATGSEL